MSAAERFDGCEVVKKLNTGPITDLYHVVQEPLGRAAFIKALGSSILPSSPFAASLEREARLLAELSHPNILEVYDFVRRGERMWLVLEYVDGVSLEDVMKRMKRVPESFACAVALWPTRTRTASCIVTCNRRTSCSARTARSSWRTSALRSTSACLRLPSCSKAAAVTAAPRTCHPSRSWANARTDAVISFRSACCCTKCCAASVRSTAPTIAARHSGFGVTQCRR